MKNGESNDEHFHCIRLQITAVIHIWRLLHYNRDRELGWIILKPITVLLHHPCTVVSQVPAGPQLSPFFSIKVELKLCNCATMHTPSAKVIMDSEKGLGINKPHTHTHTYVYQTWQEEQK